MNNRSFIKDELKKRSRVDKENKRGELNSSPGIRSVFFFNFEWVEREFWGYGLDIHTDIESILISVQAFNVCMVWYLYVQVLAMKIFNFYWKLKVLLKSFFDNPMPKKDLLVLSICTKTLFTWRGEYI